MTLCVKKKSLAVTLWELILKKTGFDCRLSALLQLCPINHLKHCSKSPVQSYTVLTFHLIHFNFPSSLNIPSTLASTHAVFKHTVPVVQGFIIKPGKLQIQPSTGANAQPTLLNILIYSLICEFLCSCNAYTHHVRDISVSFAEAHKNWHYEC